MSSKISKNDILKRFKGTHKCTYDYSKIDYKNLSTKVEIICQKHGSFHQTPTNHISGSRCPSCVKEERYLTTEQVIQRCKLLQTNYNYSKIDYKDSKTKITITCPVHGDFRQLFTNHLKGQGCPKCAGKQLSHKENLYRCKEIHKNRYKYNLESFSHQKIEIQCPEHGKFYQKLSNHLKGQGCPKCAGKGITTNSLIDKFKKVHTEYDYSKVNYKNPLTKITITCPVHGDFKQLPYSHLKGQGCPKCANLLKSRDYFTFYQNSEEGLKPGLFYFLKFTNEKDSFLKIGITKRSLKQRFDHTCFKDFNMEKIFIFKSSLRKVSLLEKTILNTFKSDRLFNKFDGYTECFPTHQQDNIYNFILGMDLTNDTNKK